MSRDSDAFGYYHNAHMTELIQQQRKEPWE